MLTPYFINESFIDQLFNQNPVSLLITRIQPGRVGFGNGIIKGENFNFQIRRLISFTYQNQKKNYYQLSFSKQFTRFSMFFQNPKSQESYYFAGFRVFPHNSFSAFIGNTKNKGYLVTKQYLDVKILNNYCLSYFLDALKISQNFLSQATIRIFYPNFAESDIRLRTVWKDRYLINMKYDKQPQIEMGLALPLSNSLYFSVISNIFFNDQRINQITQFTQHYKGFITKMGIESNFVNRISTSPYIQFEMVLNQDPCIILKGQYKNQKPSLQINFECDSLKEK
ncbi:unnamed protein product [Paramecium pentaurelia]|uniref:Uncharacterized protein n=1 Tax=Paramecium pentaurelia TaxID=43138 RepID=A0A8S1T7G7_9CILI|nr:unnamed protein product [Paramecium pentaurelia]